MNTNLVILAVYCSAFAALTLIERYRANRAMEMARPDHKTTWIHTGNGVVITHAPGGRFTEESVPVFRRA